MSAIKETITADIEDGMKDTTTMSESFTAKSGIISTKRVDINELIPNPNGSGGWLLPQRTVEVRPIPMDKWHGKKGANSFTAAKTIEALYDAAVAGYATGLTEEEKIILEDLVGRKLDNKFTGKAHEFWNSNAGYVKLPNHTFILYLNRPYDYIKYKVLKASPYCANALEDYTNGVAYEATHYIHNETDISSKEASKVLLRKQAYDKIGALSPQSLRDIILIMSETSARGRDDNFVIAEIGRLVDTRTQEFLDTIKLESDFLSARALVREGIIYGVLVQDSHKGITFNGEPIGLNFEQAVDYVRRPEHQQIRLMITNKIQAVT